MIGTYVTPLGQVQWVEASAQPWVTRYAVAAQQETFGQRLRRFRENAGLSQEDFAQLANLSRKTVQTIENHKTARPTIKNEVVVVTKMAEVCKVPVSELSVLLGWVPTPTADPNSWENGLSDEEKQAVKHVAELLRRAKLQEEDPPPPRITPVRPQRATGS